MRLNQGVEWAAHACTVLATVGPERGLSLSALAEFHAVPGPYMAKQMQLLSKAGLVRTTRGKTGGYTLARSPSAITLWDITQALNGSDPLFRCTEIRQQGPCAASRKDCRRACTIARAFAQAEAAWRQALQAVTLAEIAQEVGAQASTEKVALAQAWLQAKVTRLQA